MELLLSIIFFLIIVVGPIYLIFYVRQKNRRCPDFWFVQHNVYIYILNIK